MGFQRILRSGGRAAAAALVVCGIAVSPAIVDAKPGDKDKKAQKEEKATPGVLKVAPALNPPGLAFGMSPKKVYEVYDKAIEQDFLPRYKEVEPGIQMQRLDYEKKQYKDTFRLSYVTFDSPPSSLDGTKLVTEFTYGNDEGMMRLKRKGKNRYLFFIKSKLWNIVDVYALKEGGKFGPDFKTAVETIEKRLKVPGKAVAADADKGVPYDMVQWDDGKMWLRLMNWGNNLAISYADLDTVKRLGDLRKKSEGDKEDMDPSVKSVLRTPKDTSGQEPDKKKKKK